MELEVKDYVKSYMVYQLNKIERKKGARFLQPLPTLNRPCQSGTMDFINRFPSLNWCKSIMVVIDRFSKYAVFVTTLGACPVEEIAKLFYNHVVKYFGLPEDIVSDRDTRFTGPFWAVPLNSMGSKLRFSTTNHP